MRQRSSLGKSRRDSERGYALLMVFLMAAIVAIMLYQQLPRVAFESEREKEQLLIDRGEQYTRAIQLYYLANNRQYPTSIDDLEKSEKRFLRRRYVDPYTGKDEWRIIHTTGGFLIDSLVQKPPATNASQDASNTNNSNNTAPADQQPQVNAAVLARPSDRPSTPTPGFTPPFPVQDPNAQQNISQNTQQNNGALPPITLQPQQGPSALPPITLQPQQGPGALPPITLQPNAGNQPGGLPPITLGTIGTGTTGAQGGQQVPGQLPGQLRAGGGIAAPLPGQTPPGGLPGGIPTGVPPGFRIDPSGQLVPNNSAGAQILNQSLSGQTQGIPGQPVSSQSGTTFGTTQTQPFNQNQPGGPDGPPNPALAAITQILTSPRQTVTTPVQTSNQVGAIAGIASTHKGPSIKVYKDQSKYEMWEFVFSPTNSTVPGGGTNNGQQGIPTPTGNTNTPGASTPNSFSNSGSSIFGPSPGR